MHKRSLVLFIILLIFWLVISASLDPQHLIMGFILSFITVLLWHDLEMKLPDRLSIGIVPRLLRCLALLAMYVVKSNISVAQTLLFNSPSVSPIFITMTPPLETNWGRVLLATCITITPGTVTIDVDPETGNFIVHSLTEESAVSLFYWRIIDEVQSMEAYLKRRSKDAVDTSSTYGPDTLDSSPGNYRANSN